MSQCNGLNQDLISGYLDNELTQGLEQRVRIHLEDCEVCRRIHEEMKQMREVSMNTQFKEPDNDQWGELPKTPASSFFRRIGWLFFLAWAVLIAGYTIYEIATGPEDLFGKLLFFGGISGFLLLFLSVLIDRLKTLKNDPYRRIDK